LVMLSGLREIREAAPHKAKKSSAKKTIPAPTGAKALARGDLSREDATPTVWRVRRKMPQRRRVSFL